AVVVLAKVQRKVVLVMNGNRNQRQRRCVVTGMARFIYHVVHNHQVTIVSLHKDGGTMIVKELAFLDTYFSVSRAHNYGMQSLFDAAATDRHPFALPKPYAVGSVARLRPPLQDFHILSVFPKNHSKKTSVSHFANDSGEIVTGRRLQQQ